MQRPASHAHGAEGDLSPGFPTSAPYHTKDTLSPTAAPWASSVPHGAVPAALSPTKGAAAAVPPPDASIATATAAATITTTTTDGFALPRPVGGGGFATFGDIGAGAGATFSLSAMGGAGGGFPAPGAAAAAVAAAHAAGPQRRAPEAVIQTAPRMPAAAAPPAVPSQPARKRIGSAEDLKRFLEGQSVKDFMAFILSINEAVTGKKCNDAAYVPSPALHRMCALLSELSALVDEVPPEQQSLRYGNPAFRTWSARLAERAAPLLESVLGSEAAAAAPAVAELVPYLLDSFGNATRIDYGTGHETQFCALLYCLAKLGVFGEADRQGLGLVVFKQYLELMHKIQTTYWLEPAGSHGVWGLDDYQFLPFIWGSAQLIAHPVIKPKSIHNPDILEAYADTYLYLNCVKFVKQVKKGPLGETSPMLNDISCVPTWAKVNSGMIKMYQVEVLSKFPIMQHFMFGSLLPFE
ncbi:hypothetical protein PLESTB_000206100 [Pleodorina starrii]|uniref:Serine/threonine-protein phosphatase 2A activator n=1 Tax=Pleodorina starrii TaxID=330485 RepID=A0A9W6EY22_9CHLO|nr:hypothetical protein PLESTM_000325400 [Pleodorina starrii]GLC49317.1 hypothetical protein PLESTB_000206100 [Pleodorina starrii]GLC73426.1 hypothetical protein PLESTF_001374100 [Pleodorina starrii]